MVSVISASAEFPAPGGEEVPSTVCPQCGGAKRKASKICAQCKRDNQADAKQARMRAPVAPGPAMRDMFIEHPYTEPLDEYDETVTPDRVIQNVAEKAAEQGKKIAGWDEDDLDLITYLISSAVFIGIGWATLAATDDRSYAPTHGECTNICMPLARIIARRVKVPGMRSGDTKDTLAILAAVAGYGMRCYNTAQLKHEERLEAQRHQQQPIAAQVAERMAPPVTTAPNPETVPPPNGTAPVITGRAAIPWTVRQNLQEQGKL